jgi:hypothetical protein
MIYFLKGKGANYKKLSVFHRFNSLNKIEIKIFVLFYIKIYLFILLIFKVIFDLKIYLKHEKLLEFLKIAYKLPIKLIWINKKSNYSSNDLFLKS